MSTAPAGTKKPQDHKLKKTDAIEFEFEGEKYTFTRAALEDDFEILEYLQEEKHLVAVKKILGDTQWSRFKESIRDDDGRIPVEKATEFIELMFEQVDSGK